MNGPHLAATPGVIEAARTCSRAAVSRALAHCRAFLADGGTLPRELRAWLAEYVACLEVSP
jgi:hypothetical protein